MPVSTGVGLLGTTTALPLTNGRSRAEMHHVIRDYQLTKFVPFVGIIFLVTKVTWGDYALERHYVLNCISTKKDRICQEIDYWLSTVTIDELGASHRRTGRCEGA